MVIFFYIAIFILIILFTPIFFSLAIDIGNKSDLQIGLWKNLFVLKKTESCWKFALIGISITFKTNKKKNKSKRKEKKTTQKDNTNNFKSIFGIIKTPGLLKLWTIAIFKSLKKILTLFKFKEFHTNLHIGLGNPAQTGMFFGIWYPLKKQLDNFRIKNTEIKINLSPDFTKDKIYGKATIKGKTYIFKMFIPIFVFIWQAPWIRTYKTLR